MRKKTIKGWFLKLWKDGVRRRFLIWQIKVLLKGYHLSANPFGGGRKKKIDHLNIDDLLSEGGCGGCP